MEVHHIDMFDVKLQVYINPLSVTKDFLGGSYGLHYRLD